MPNALRATGNVVLALSRLPSRETVTGVINAWVSP